MTPFAQQIVAGSPQSPRTTVAKARAHQSLQARREQPDSKEHATAPAAARVFARCDQAARQACRLSNYPWAAAPLVRAFGRRINMVRNFSICSSSVCLAIKVGRYLPPAAHPLSTALPPRSMKIRAGGVVAYSSELHPWEVRSGLLISAQGVTWR